MFLVHGAVGRGLRHQSGWELQGQAWGGNTAVARVTVTTDGGATWHEASVTPAAEHFEDGVRSHWAWATFRFVWPAAPGTYRLGSRAYGADGSEQPMEQPADWQGHFDQVGVKWLRVVVP